MSGQSTRRGLGLASLGLLAVPAVARAQIGRRPGPFWPGGARLADEIPESALGPGIGHTPRDTPLVPG
jgi:hypothetical protein